MTRPSPQLRYWPTVTLADTEWEQLLDSLLPTKIHRLVEEQVVKARNARLERVGEVEK